MNKAISIALLVVGIILLAFAWNKSQSAASEISEAFTGSPTDATVWYLVGGAVLSIIGLVGLMRSPRRIS